MTPNNSGRLRTTPDDFGRFRSISDNARRTYPDSKAEGLCMGAIALIKAHFFARIKQNVREGEKNPKALRVLSRVSSFILSRMSSLSPSFSD